MRGRLVGDPLGTRILIGLGVDELGMSAQDVAPVKAALRSKSRSAIEDLTRRALHTRTAEEAHDL